MARTTFARSVVQDSAARRLALRPPMRDGDRLKLSAEFEMKAYRALADGEVRPIARIRSAATTGTRPIDIAVQVEG